MEIWKDIIDYEGRYQISNFGNVKSLSRYVPSKNGSFRHIKERILKPSILQGGYYDVDIADNYGNKTHHRNHRLVAIHFIPNPNNLPVINHIDGNKLNNHFSNLEWTTILENTQHAIKLGLMNYKKGEDHYLYHSKKEKHPMFGKTHSKESKEKMSKSQKLRTDIIKGEDIKNSKLTELEVKEIRRLYSTGNYTQNQLSKTFNVCSENISNIVLLKSWKHLI